MRRLLKRAKRVIIDDIATGKHKATIVEIKTAQFAGGQDTDWATGADGIRLYGFDQNKTATLTFSSGVVSTGVIAMQVGGENEKIINGTGIKIREEFTLSGSQTTVSIKNKASGLEGNEIKWIYKADSTGEPTTAYAQGATASSTVFSYDAETRVITLPTGVFSAGEIVVVDYFPTFSEYSELANAADNFSFTGKVYVDGWFTDPCDSKDYLMQLYAPKGKVSGAYDLSFGDTSAVQNVEIEALGSPCGGENNLWYLREYDESKIVNS